MPTFLSRLITLERKVAALEGNPSIPLARLPRTVDPRDIARCIAFIREAGTAGMVSTKLRDRFRFMRKAIAAGNPLPSELAAAGVLTEKRGNGWWYYIPDFI